MEINLSYFFSGAAALPPPVVQGQGHRHDDAEDAPPPAQIPAKVGHHQRNAETGNEALAVVAVVALRCRNRYPA